MDRAVSNPGHSQGFAGQPSKWTGRSPDEQGLAGRSPNGQGMGTLQKYRDGQGLGAPPPSMGQGGLQMENAQETRLRTPKPSKWTGRSRNGEKLGDLPNGDTKWTRVGGPPTPQMDRGIQRGPTLQMVRAVSKWRRVGGPPTLEMDRPVLHWTGLGAPQPCTT